MGMEEVFGMSTEFDDSLVIINRNKEARAPHTIIAEGMMVTQKAILQLIKRYKDDLECFGQVRFQMAPVKTDSSRGVKKKKVYMLNRDQAMFLITLMVLSTLVSIFTICVTIFVKFLYY